MSMTSGGWVHYVSVHTIRPGSGITLLQGAERSRRTSTRTAPSAGLRPGSAVGVHPHPDGYPTRLQWAQARIPDGRASTPMTHHSSASTHTAATGDRAAQVSGNPVSDPRGTRHARHRRPEWIRPPAAGRRPWRLGPVTATSGGAPVRVTRRCHARVRVVVGVGDLVASGVLRGVPGGVGADGQFVGGFLVVATPAENVWPDGVRGASGR